jgi:hypothetical protein
MSVGQASRAWLKGEEGRVSASTVASHKAAFGKLKDDLTRRGLTMEGIGLGEITRATAGEFLQERRAASAAGTVLREFSAYSGLWR